MIRILATLCLFATLIPATAPPVRAEAPAERGFYLVNGIMACGNCHSPQQPDGTVSGPALSGGPAIETPAFTAYAPNITPDQATGIGAWTAAQLVTALREGRRPDGKIIRPPMPIEFYRILSDHDAAAIAAYLQSLPPTVNEAPDSSYRAPMPQTYGPSLGAISDPDPADRVAYGGYLVRIGHCMLCHTPIGAHGQRDYDHLLGAGGQKMKGVFGTRITPNITPDRETGIGAWTDTEIKASLTKGITPDGRQLAAPMPWRYLATLRDADIDAIIAYLRTVPPKRNKTDG